MSTSPKTHLPQRTHLLIDGDIMAFMAAAASQANLLDPDSGWIMPVANTVQSEAVLENMLFSLRQGLEADSMSIYLSDDKDNWRLQVDATYKTNRKDTARPLALGHLRAYLETVHSASAMAGLEADDVLGILMTTPLGEPQEGDSRLSLCPFPVGTQLICVGRDKDFRSIPGLHHAWKQDVDSSGKMLIREVSQWEADRFHMIQALAGDRVDGYYGCAGIGMDRAAAIIDNPTRLVPKEGIKTRGVNKGEATTKWIAEPTRDYWACITSHFRKAGMTDDDALRTARLARILRYGEYDRETEEVTLWTPDMLRGVGQ